MPFTFHVEYKHETDIQQYEWKLLPAIVKC